MQCLNQVLPAVLHVFGEFEVHQRTAQQVHGTRAIRSIVWGVVRKEFESVAKGLAFRGDVTFASGDAGAGKERVDAGGEECIRAIG